MPPLLLDDDEAIAVAISVGLAENGSTGIADIDQSMRRALAKLERILPKRLQRTVNALRESTAVGPATTGSREPDAPVPARDLAGIAAAIRARRVLDFDDRRVEPYPLVSWPRRWDLVGYDLDGHRWHAFPVAGRARIAPTGRHFAARTLPEEDLVAFVLREIASAGWKVHARVTVLAPAQTVIDRINPAVGVVEPIDDESCLLLTGADAMETLAIYLSMLMMDFRIDGPPELVAHIRTL